MFHHMAGDDGQDTQDLGYGLLVTSHKVQEEEEDVEEAHQEEEEEDHCSW